MTTYEQQLIFALRGEPALCRTEGLGEKLFTSPECRRLFTAISDLFEENGDDGPVDLTILSVKSGIPSERIGQIASVEAGCYNRTGNNFADWIRFQQQDVDRLEWAELYEKESQAYVKTGIVDLESVARVRAHCDKLLDRGGSGFDPTKVLITGAEMQNLDIKMECTIDKLVPCRSLILLHGPGGLAKTWLALCMSKAVSEGLPFLGLATKQRFVVYVDFENPWPMLIDRVKKLNIREVRFWHLSNPTRPPKLDSPDWTMYKNLPRDSFLIFDTARSSFDGDENSSQDVGLVMNRLKEIRELGNDVLLLHHTPRRNERASKGSTAWEDLADHVLAFYKVKKETLEDTDEEVDFDPRALLSLGTGRKTRYEPFRMYLTLDPDAGGFVVADDPKVGKIDQLADYIAGEGLGKNQTAIVAWAKDALGIKKRDNALDLLKLGEGSRWKKTKGFNGVIYEPL